MAYQFAGFFARPVLPPPDALPPDAAWREITSPFKGVGLRLPRESDELLSRDEAAALARRYGLEPAKTWLWIHYSCWGGTIDFVHGLGSRTGEPFGPLEGELDRAEPAYLALMKLFGVSVEDALQFPPFVRGFWGEEW